MPHGGEDISFKLDLTVTRRESMLCTAAAFAELVGLPQLRFAVSSGPPVDAANVLSFGATGNGHTDDTAAIQRALNSGNHHVWFPGGKTYLVHGAGQGSNNKPDGALRVRSNTTVWGPGIVKLAPGQREFTSVFQLDDLRDVAFRGVKVNGNKAVQNPRTDRGQNGGLHGIAIYGGNTIGLYNVETFDCFVDGVYLANSMLTSREAKGITIDGLKSTGNRRQGMSIIHVDGLTCRRSLFSNTAGQEPQAGVDIEPDRKSQAIRNVRFEDCEFSGNAGAGFKLDARAPVINVTLLRLKMFGNRRGDDADLSIVLRGAVLTTALVQDCTIERRIDLHGRDDYGTFRGLKVRRNILRGPRARITATGSAPSGNSVIIEGNLIATSMRKAIDLGSWQGITAKSNQVSVLS
jgi:hypothetical protein